MSIYDLTDIIGIPLIIKKIPHSTFACSFENSIVKNYLSDAGGALINGWGNSPEASVADYVRQIGGKFLIAKRIERRSLFKKEKILEFAIPHNLAV